jgi:hypothetical protein
MPKLATLTGCLRSRPRGRGSRDALALAEPEVVVVTDEDHGHPFGLKEPVDAASLIRDSIGDAKVTAVAFRSPANDLLLSFSNGWTLEVLVGSGGYENWHVHGPDGFPYVRRWWRKPQPPSRLVAGMGREPTPVSGSFGSKAAAPLMAGTGGKRTLAQPTPMLKMAPNVAPHFAALSVHPQRAEPRLTVHVNRGRCAELSH